MPQPTVTLIVTQRERFSFTKIALDSVLADYSSYPFQLIYVDGNSPLHVYQYLQKQASKHEFMTLLRQEKYLRANEARNLGLQKIKTTDYVVFLENDVIVEPGWLKPLVECAEEEQVAIVSPLIFQGDPQEKEIHVFGIEVKFDKTENGKHSFKQKHLLRGKKMRDLHQELRRSSVDAVDIHCLLVRHSLMKSVVLDEVFDNMEGNVDLSLQTTAIGEKILVEPSSTVTFLDPQLIAGFDQDDIPFYLFRWSEKSVRAIVAHTKQKWNLDGNDPSVWGRWWWVMQYRQLPARLATSEGGLCKKLLQISQRHWCPSQLRTLLEHLVLKLAFPRLGIATSLRQVSNLQKVEI